MKQKWKGELTKDLLSLGRSEKGLPPEFKKGDTVICKKKRVYDEYSCWTGEYEFHYSNENGKGLVRTSEFLIKE